MATDLALPRSAGAASASDRRSRIVEHFERCWPDYRWIWGAGRHGGMHVGLRGGGRGHDASVLHTNRVLAEAVGICGED